MIIATPKPLTERQKEVFEFIDRYQQEHDSSPSIREIRDFMGARSSAAPYRILKPLERKGYLRIMRHDGRYIGLDLFENGKDQAEMTVAGVVAAGVPVAPFEAVELMSFQDFFQDGNTTMKVTDDCMESDHIIDGDYIVAGRGANGPALKGIIRKL